MDTRASRVWIGCTLCVWVMRGMCACARAEVWRQKERSWSSWASTVCAAAEQSIDDAGTLSVDDTFYIEHILKRTHAVGVPIYREHTP